MTTSPRELLESTLPDPELRRRILEAMAGSIRRAHELNPACWEVSHLPSKGSVRLNVGRIYMFDVMPDSLWITARLTGEEAEDLGLEKGEASNSLPRARLVRVDFERFPTVWEHLESPHLEALEVASEQTSRTPYFAHHSPEAVAAIEQLTGGDLPAPDYLSVDLNEETIRSLVSTLEAFFPGWEGFDDPRYEEDERKYKETASKEAKDRLSESELRRLIDQRDYDEIVERLKKVGQTNMLFHGVPKSGDLAILHREGVDREALAHEILALLYGNDESPDRLDRFARWVDEQGLPNKWTFPTYYLFLLHPQTEIFVKPSGINGFLQHVGLEADFHGRPEGDKYRYLQSVAARLEEVLAEAGYPPKDMIDIQGFMWCVAKSPARIISDHLEKLEPLYEKCLRQFVPSEAGKDHLERTRESRKNARENLEILLSKYEHGEDISSLAPLWLLPHVDTEANRERNAWRPPAAFAKAPVKLLEAQGNITADDWPDVAEALLQFVQTSLEDPESLPEACAALVDHPKVKGLQSGTLSPILNALNPDEFQVINAKPATVFQFLTGGKLSTRLKDYPESNWNLLAVVKALRPFLDRENAPDLSPADCFDLFTHFLVAVENYDFPETRYWKISPGEQAWHWDDCLEQGFISLGWEDLGDVTGMNRKKFESHFAKVSQGRPDDNDTGWGSGGMEQVWKFVNEVKIGDYVVANKGTSIALGFGRITGECEYVEEGRNRLRRPVEWFDTEPRKIDQGGWRRTLISLDRDTFEELRSASDDSPFTPSTFELLAQLHENPTRDFYNDHKDEFKEHVEAPFQALFHAVVERLPPAILDAMETERYLFSQIPKNDWGRGGAWDFYWGAIYPKEGKRTTHAQLFGWLNAEVLGTGFYIGEYSEEPRERFLRNVNLYREQLSSILGPELARHDLLYGEHAAYGKPDRQNRDFEALLAAPKEIGARIAARWNRDQLLSTTRDELAEKIAAIFSDLFPLVLLTTSEDPLPAISEYLGEAPPPPETNPEHPLSAIVAATGFARETLQRWVRAVERKKQAIFYGPPGTGKTFVAEHLARHLIGGGDGLTELVQFHPSYAYEDFIQGIRPDVTADGELTYKMFPGRFRDFCQRAERREGISVLIIDEINRANLSRVFGELMYLLEYRDHAVPLAGGATKFRIPGNVRLIGTMNTADRSIALVDHALRRRFAFLHLDPSFQALRHYHRENTSFDPGGLIQALEQVNQAIDDPNYSVGISFFCREDIEEQIEDIWRMEIEPYLEEFFFNDPGKVTPLRWDHLEPTIRRPSPVDELS